MEKQSDIKDSIRLIQAHRAFVVEYEAMNSR